MFSRLVLALGLLGAATTAQVQAAGSNKYIPALSENVLADLAKLDPSEYQTYHLQDTSDAIAKRAPPNGLTGIQERCTASRCYDFTFDDGPYNNMRNITDHATSNGFKVTFFVNLNNYDCMYNAQRVSDLRYAYGKGMQICSHTATHPHLNTLTHAQIDHQIQGVEDALWKILGAVPACIRPPYGEANDDVVDYLNNRWGYVVINWNIDSGDSTGSTVEESKATLRQVKAPKHAIVLMHETEDTTPNQLFPAAIKIAKNNGYTSANHMTVPASLGFNGYKVTGTRGTRDSTWTCDGYTPGEG